MRTLAGIVAGLLLAITIIMTTEAIGHRVFPLPENHDLNSGSAMSLPTATLLVPVLGWFLAALAGSWLAARIARKHVAGYVVGGVVLAATIANFVMITHPVGIVVAGVAAVLAGTWLGSRVAVGSATKHG